MIQKIKQGTYCFKRFGEDPSSYVMSHSYTCDSSLDLCAWDNIKSANFFDIKLSSRHNDIKTYFTVINKIRFLSKVKFCFIHFSNLADEPLMDLYVGQRYNNRTYVLS
jgi:hypothetical protein